MEYRGLALGIALVRGVVDKLRGLVPIQNAPRVRDIALLVHDAGVYQLSAKTPDAFEVLFYRALVARRRMLVLHVLCRLRKDRG